MLDTCPPVCPTERDHPPEKRGDRSSMPQCWRCAEGSCGKAGGQILYIFKHETAKALKAQGKGAGPGLRANGKGAGKGVGKGGRGKSNQDSKTPNAASPPTSPSPTSSVSLTSSAGSNNTQSSVPSPDPVAYITLASTLLQLQEQVALLHGKMYLKPQLISMSLHSAPLS